MSKKDYEIIVKALQASAQFMKDYAAVIERFAYILDKNYKNFNYDRFVRACKTIQS